MFYVTETRVSGAALGHSYGPVTVIAAATCDLPGTTQQTCSRCGYVKTTVVPALLHQWGAWVQTLTPTCTTGGANTSTCSRCGNTKTQALPPLGHQFGAYAVVTPATCTHAGLSERTCARCGQKEGLALAQLPHQLGPWQGVKAPTCTEQGLEVRKCATCTYQENRSLKALGHKSDEQWYTVRGATTSRRGLQATTCTVCGQNARTRNFAPRAFRYEVDALAWGVPASMLNAGFLTEPDRLIWLDLTTDASYTFPLVAENAWLIGTAHVTVRAGSVAVSLGKASEPTLLTHRAWYLFPDAASATAARFAGKSLPFDQPVRAEGDSCVISISMQTNYYRGNENQPFDERLLAPGGGSYVDLVDQMLQQMISAESTNE